MVSIILVIYIMTINFRALARRFDGPSIEAIALMGSHARGDAGLYSDIDLLRLVAEGDGDAPGAGSHLIDDSLVVVSNATPSTVARWFVEPDEASAVIAGLRQGIALFDEKSRFTDIQERARAFQWDAAMQAKANALAGEQMVGWIEEAHKGVEGLRRNDIGRMLHGRFGLSWGLSRVMQLYRGILIEGDNDFYEALVNSMGQDSEWTRLRATAYGLDGPDKEPPTIRQSVVAGLQLYVLTADMLETDLMPEHREMVMATVKRIQRALVHRQS